MENELPPEPANGSVVLDINNIAWQRDGNQWYPATDVDFRDDYAGIGSLMWGLLNKLFGPAMTLAPLEPQPEPATVAFPWTGQSAIAGYSSPVVTYTGPSADSAGVVRVGVGHKATSLSEATARQMAVALLRAARRVESLNEAHRRMEEES